VLPNDVDVAEALCGWCGLPLKVGGPARGTASSMKGIIREVIVLNNNSELSPKDYGLSIFIQ
jgi:hypothetical protein